MHRFLRASRESLADDSGVVALIFAFVLVVLVCALGLAIDASRASRASAMTLDAMDAAALAAAKGLVEEGWNNSEITDHVQAYLEAQFKRGGGSEGATYSGLSVSSNANNGAVDISLQLHVPTTFARLLHYRSIDISKQTTTRYVIKNVELAMVLDTTGSMLDFNKINELKAAASQAIDVLLPSNKQPLNRIALAPYAASINVGGFDNAVSNGASTDHCVVERQSAEAFTDAPAQGADSLLAADTAYNPNYSCPAQEVMPLNKHNNQLQNAVANYVANGGTAGHIGLAWGWYLLSPNWSALLPGDSQPKPYGDPKTIKAVLLMSDGMFNTSYYNGAINTTSPTQAATLCDNIKAAGIKIYTVGFELAQNPAPDDQNARDLLSTCASDDGKGGKEFYDVGNGADLTAAFKDIAGKLQSLRLAS